MTLITRHGPLDLCFTPDGFTAATTTSLLTQSSVIGQLHESPRVHVASGHEWLVGPRMRRNQHPPPTVLVRALLTTELLPFDSSRSSVKAHSWVRFSSSVL